MVDVLQVVSASALIDTGKGFLAGIVISCSSTTAAQVVIYDDLGDEFTDKLLEAWAAAPNPLVIFFADRFAPRYNTRLYIFLEANLVATVWTHQV